MITKTDKTNEKEEILTRVRSNELAIRPIDSTEKEEPCAFSGCKHKVYFNMEELFVCLNHADVLLLRFITRDATLEANKNNKNNKNKKSKKKKK